MRNLCIQSFIALCIVFVPVALFSENLSPEKELKSLASQLFRHTNNLVNLNTDLIEVAKACNDREVVYVYSLVDKIGDILIISFYEGRLLETSLMIHPQSLLMI